MTTPRGSQRLTTLLGGTYPTGQAKRDPLTDEALGKIEEVGKRRCRVCRCEEPWHYSGCVSAALSATDTEES
jgi:hypothetical protein